MSMFLTYQRSVQQAIFSALPESFDFVHKAMASAVLFNCPLQGGVRLESDMPLEAPYPTTWVEVKPGHALMYHNHVLYGIRSNEFVKGEGCCFLPVICLPKRHHGIQEEIANTPWRIQAFPQPGVLTEELLEIGKGLACCWSLFTKFLHCRNIKTVDAGRPDNITIKACWNTTKKPCLVQYKVLRIVHKDKTEQDLSEIIKDMPLHAVRGHFKTYTPERPMLGQHVGTFWYPAHARGDAKNGVITKDYDCAV